MTLTSTARQVIATPEDAGQRVDNFLLRILKGVPRSHVYRLLRTGQVRVNAGRVKPHYRLRAGDTVRLPPVRQTVYRAPGVDARAGAGVADRILHEDSWLLVVDKPSGMAVHGGSGVSAGVIEALRAARPDVRSLELVHRLDRETSGCLIIAKRRSTLRALHTELRAARVHKFYLTLLAGSPEDVFEVKAPLVKNVLRSGERMVMVDKAGKRAVSRFRVLKRFSGAVLAEVRIETGRTHQIRVHAATAGFPVAGDTKYGNREVNRRFRDIGLKRMFLHAHALEFRHPGSGEPFAVSAPLDGELKQVIDELESPPY